MLRIDMFARISLDQVAEAHRAAEDRRIAGSIVIVP